MTQSLRDFDDRVRRIEKKSGRRGGMRVEVDQYGNTRRVRRRPSSLLRLLRGLVLLALAAILFKSMAFAYLGEGAFLDRAEALSQGARWERIVGQLMQPDPITGELGGRLRPYIKHL